MTFESCTTSEVTCEELLIEHEDGNKTTYTKCGLGNALVFLHAGGLNKEMWENQLQYFKQDFQVISYNMRGHGSSSFVANERLEIDDLADILNHEGIKSTHLVGCSLGSIIALDFALAYPQMVEKLVLVSPGLVSFQEADTIYQSQIANYITSIQQADTTAMVASLMEMNALGTKVEIPSDVDRYVRLSLTSFIENGSFLRPPRIKEIDPKARLGEVKSETLIMSGDLDHPYIQANGDHLEQNLPNASQIKLESVAHLVNLESPKRFSEELSTFLKDNSD